MPPPGEIALRLDRAAQLFHTLDPTPFREGDLDGVAEAYILDCARELPPEAPIRILVHLPAAELEGAHAMILGTAIPGFFAARAREETQALRELFRTGRQAAAIGVGILAACLSGALLVADWPPTGPLVRLLQESLVIVGWVAMWRPAQIFLYDWMPITRRRRLFRRLAAAQVEPRPQPAQRVGTGGSWP